jgi:hypothetical protein
MDGPNEVEVLRAFVEAHAQPHPRTGDREPIMYLRHLGGSEVQHHALEGRPPGIDEALLEDMQAKGLITIDYRAHNWNITPTSFGREVIEEQDRVQTTELVADIEPVIRALSAQGENDNPLAWPAVRPVLAALRGYWQRGGFSQHGIQLVAVADALPNEHGALFGATIRALVNGGYLAQNGVMGAVITDDSGRRVAQLPAEVSLTEKAHTILDGWPGAAPEELVENLLAVLAVAAADEPDPARKRRLERLAETIREVGVSITSEVIAKVLTGGMM